MAQRDEVADFLGEYPPAVCDAALSLRSLIRSTIPDAQEMLDRSGRVVGYGFGSGYADLVCTIIPSKAGLKLGIAGGAGLPDPRHLLEGDGKRHRYVQFRNKSEVSRGGIKDLIRAASVSRR
ncbi:MAG: DUF1801 domain-containing protein [Gemmatimonadota bacterium]|nr:DUF1801 domain-containing protein [Gemmatimonadota bacterium]